MIELIPPPYFSDVELQSLFDYRLGRIRAQMSDQNVDLCILSNPVSLRYAINFDEYQLFQSHIPTCYLFLPLEGPLVMFGASGQSFPHVKNYRRSDFLTPFDGGLDIGANCDNFLRILKDNSLAHAGGSIALERFTPLLGRAMLDHGLDVVDAECLLEKAKLIKHPHEIQCIRYAIQVAEYGMSTMFRETRPGITENQLWSILHQVNVAHGGDWIEGHMLSSGPRTNPWFQEASHRQIKAGDMVSFDTDMIGPMGYMADISRAWVCGGGPGNKEQREAYQHAYDEIHYNMELVEPGISFKELSEKAFKRQARYKSQRYPCCFHGVGLSDEYPKIYYQEDWERDGYDGVIEENMVLCVESYSGREGGKEGVKLEEMVRVTRDGYELLTAYPFEKELL